MFYVTDRIDGYFDEENSFETREEAEAKVREYEAEDKENGSYTEGFYVIVEDASPTFL